MEISYQDACLFTGEIVLEYKARLKVLGDQHTNMARSYQDLQKQLHTANERCAELERQLKDLRESKDV